VTNQQNINSNRTAILWLSIVLLLPLTYFIVNGFLQNLFLDSISDEMFGVLDVMNNVTMVALPLLGIGLSVAVAPKFNKRLRSLQIWTILFCVIPLVSFFVVQSSYPAGSVGDVLIYFFGMILCFIQAIIWFVKFFKTRKTDERNTEINAPFE